MKSKPFKSFKVDEVNLNAALFGSLSEEDAVKRMTENGILKTHGKDEAWAKKAHKACVDALKPVEEKKKK